MRVLALYLFLLPLAAFAQDGPCLSGDLSEYWSIGTARGLDGTVLYCEFHQEREVHQGMPQTRVIYRASHGEAIAEKNIVWDDSRTRPEIAQRDLRSGERIEVQRGERWLLSYQKNRKSAVEQTTLRLGEVDVVDAGFDQKVREQWDELINGGRLRVVFAAPALQRAVPLRIARREARQCARGGDENRLCFWVEADNALVRLFVDPLRLSYDSERRLRVFEGVVNIRDEEGKKQTAVIEYRYAGEW